ncbi:DUF2975 domain-containing protein [Sinomicrobium weinanense]|uniref:DUF2975 domain-containing protein n=1 Tax=Sinomicrobium weinanense TaxID=2842200 RepID=A0A926JPI7_9FLAO|nr:DUF2975 domain-containing protein [Sinomicrobium weinanense]MBC9795088.1 DUF2975 domain-containing protein [Sinomicrobium weinanense]MBU3123781.1 DUF2975 domain-containing protein [Sinomicrobium weinanense]
MRRTKIIAKTLYIISLVLAIGYSITTLYAAFCIVTGIRTSIFDKNLLHIFYPFTTKPFLIAENNTLYIIFSLLLPLGLYSIFFWMSSNVFRVFLKPVLFTARNVVHLKRFFGFNLVAPALATVIGSFFVPIEDFILALVVVHFFLGIFIYFLAAIFNQGIGLQNEQDLFI